VSLIGLNKNPRLFARDLAMLSSIRAPHAILWFDGCAGRAKLRVPTGVFEAAGRDLTNMPLETAL
jgi:hypothetical protein